MIAGRYPDIFFNHSTATQSVDFGALRMQMYVSEQRTESKEWRKGEGERKNE
jgi:hypothetical protein